MKTIFALVITLIMCSNLTAQTPNTNERIVKISTSYGDITIKLYNETPLHRDNFIKLISQGYYNGTLFHRVINKFMIQGGDPDSRGAKPRQQLGNGGPEYTIPFEYAETYYHKRGALAAARMPDDVNPEKASSGSQFYIVQGRTFTDAELDAMESRTGREFTEEQRNTYKTVGGTPHLDGEYTVFGEVISGMDVVDKIAAVAVDRYSRPMEDIQMTITIVQ